VKSFLLVNICLWSFGVIEGQSLRFNELMTINTHFYSDDGNPYPWIEFINTTSSTLNLSKFYISSDSSNLQQWRLPSSTVEADTLFLLWFSGNGTLHHADFTLDANATYLLLTDGQVILDYVPLTSMVENESYGKRKGFHDAWVYFMNSDDVTAGTMNVDPGPWVKIQSKAAFKKGDAGYYGCLVYDNKMWVLDYETLDEDGNWVNLVEVWSSSDGYNWKVINATPPYKHGSMVTVFNGYMWAFDGRAFRSADGIIWEQVSSDTPVAERVAVFNNCLWILDDVSLYKSCDGVTWEKALEQVPWYPRNWPAFMEHNGKLWMFGGNINYRSGYDMYFTDVWSSADGINWELKNYKAPWRGTFWFTYASYDGKMWMIDGGWNYWDRLNPYNGNGNEVWYSEDGVNWQQSSAPTNWFNRHAQFTWVFKDELWIGAGYAGGGAHHLYNDIWKYSRRSHPLFPHSQIATSYGSKIPLTLPEGSQGPVHYTLADPSVALWTNDTLTATKAGETVISLSQQSNDFYRSTEQEINLMVSKRDLVVKPLDVTIAFGDAFPDFTLAYTGFALGDKVDSLQTSPTIANIPDEFASVGTYWLSAQGGYDENYNFNFEEGKLTINSSRDNTLFFPNPVEHTLQVISSLKVEGKVVFDFYSSSGFLIAQHVQNDFERTKFDLSDLSPGLYILHITSKNGKEARKIVKI
jgi:hypothetical protein